MSHCLVTFLGRVQGGNYRIVDYRFPDGHRATAAFLGFPLREWLAADHLVVLGTRGSMWDHLLEGDIPLQGAEAEREQLLEDAQAGHVEQARLDDLAPRLGEALGCTVTLRIIPAALETTEQQHVLSELAEVTESATRLSIDVTHGFRHLPMLAYTAALYLRALRPALRVDGLWYGHLEDQNQASVRNMAGLLEVSEWLVALQRYDWLGDYSGVADRIEHQDGELAENLRSASFSESIHQGQQARSQIRKARKRLEQQDLSGAGQLFAPALYQRLGWVEEATLDRRQARQAWNALDRQDYLRASLYGFEAFVTRLSVQHHGAGQGGGAEARQEAKDVFERRRPSAQWPAYKLLRILRNVLAHGGRAHTKEAQRAISSPAELEKALRECFNTLLGEHAA